MTFRNTKSVTFIILLIVLNSCSLADRRADSRRPHIFNYTRYGLPGDAVNLQGHGFGEMAEVWIDRVEDGDPFPTIQVDSLLNASDTCINVRIPTQIAMGLYALYVKNESGISDPVFLNKAMPWSLLDAGGAEIYPGQKLRLYGWNLDLDGATSRVFLRPEGSGEDIALIVHDTDSVYTVELVMPKELNLSDSTRCKLHCTNGYGGSIGISEGPEVVVRTAALSDRWNTQITWIKNLSFLSNTYDVTSDPRLTVKAVGDGHTNDGPAIQAAIDKAAADGGGIVLLPAGVYRISGGVRLDSHVVLEGSDANEVHLISDEAGFAAIDGSHAKSCGLIGLTIESLPGGTAHTVFLSHSERSFVGNCILRNTNTASSVPHKIRDTGVLICKNTRNLAVFGNTVEYPTLFEHMTNVINFRNGSYLYCANNSFRFFRTRLDVTQNVNMQYENNHMKHIAGDPQGASRGLWCSGYHHFISGNIISKDGEGYYVRHNDGESICYDGSHRRELAKGAVRSAGPESLVGNPTWRTSWGKDFFVGRRVFIYGGKGAGQYRIVVANTADTLTVDSPWTVIPDSSSRFCIYGQDRQAFGHILIQNNQISDQSQGISLYGQGLVDFIVANNRTLNAGGVTVIGFDNDHTVGPLYNGLIAGNHVSRDISRDRPNLFHGAWIWLHASYWDNKAMGMLLSGVVIRRNTIQAVRPALHGIGGVALRTEGYVIEGHRSDHVATILGTILDENEAYNVDCAVTLKDNVQTVIKDLVTDDSSNGLCEKINVKDLSVVNYDDSK